MNIIFNLQLIIILIAEVKSSGLTVPNNTILLKKYFGAKPHLKN